MLCQPTKYDGGKHSRPYPTCCTLYDIPNGYVLAKIQALRDAELFSLSQRLFLQPHYSGHCTRSVTALNCSAAWSRQ